LAERATTKLVRRLLRYQARQRAALTSIIGPAPAWPVQVPIQTAASVNAPDIHRVIRDLRATHLFVYGTGILSAATLQLGTTLNLHTGLSPYYRGSDTEFWPIYLDDLVHLGVTVHACTPALDGGAIYARACVRLEPDDDHFSAFARCVQRGAELYAHMARLLATGEMLTPIPQDAIGRSYRFVDRTFVHDLTMEARFRTGRVRRLIAQKLELPFP
jgi:methionyl-tRNA formyltransferase